MFELVAQPCARLARASRRRPKRSPGLATLKLIAFAMRVDSRINSALAWVMRAGKPRDR